MSESNRNPLLLDPRDEDEQCDVTADDLKLRVTASLEILLARRVKGTDEWEEHFLFRASSNREAARARYALRLAFLYGELWAGEAIGDEVGRYVREAGQEAEHLKSLIGERPEGGPDEEPF